MLRPFANSVLSLMVMATFLWGGCVSCEQYFMFPGKRQSCCNQSGQCERPGKSPSKPERTDCNRLPFERTPAAHVVPMLAVVPAALTPAVIQFSPLVRLSHAEVASDPSPPDLQALNVTFLI